MLTFSKLVRVHRNSNDCLHTVVSPLSAVGTLSHYSLRRTQRAQRVLRIRTVNLTTLHHASRSLITLHRTLNIDNDRCRNSLSDCVTYSLIFRQHLISTTRGPALDRLCHCFSDVINTRLHRALGVAPQHRRIFSLRIRLLSTIRRHSPRQTGTLSERLVGRP